MDAESETVSLAIGDATYKLARELTGRQYLQLRRLTLSIRRQGDNSASMEPPEATQNTQVELDEAEYEMLNLFYRLVEPKYDSKNAMIDSMNRKTLHSLSLAAVRLDNQESGEVVDFLRENSSLFEQSELNSVLSSPSHPPTSEVSSESEESS